MKNSLMCPVCGGKLDDEMQCSAQGCSFSDKFELSHIQADATAIADQLRSTGRAFVHATVDELVILQKRQFRCSLHGPSSAQLDHLATTLCRRLQLSRKYCTRHTVRDLLVHLSDSDVIPSIQFLGDFPVLALDKDKDELFFPVKEDSESSRFVRQYGLYYTGPMLRPRWHGGVFDEWLDTFRYATPEDKQIIRGWILGLLVQWLVPFGRVPALLLAAVQNGTGKTETARMISKMFGPHREVYWEKVKGGKTNLDREMASGVCRFMIIDNLVAGASGVIDEPELANLLTKETNQTMRLYSQSGYNEAPKMSLEVLTANSPALSCELLSRVVPAALSKERPTCKDWIETWYARRVDVLEEAMHIVIENWKKNKTQEPPAGYRNVDWFNNVSRANGGELVVRPKHSPVITPLELFLDWYVEDDVVDVEAVVEELKSCRRGPGTVVARQTLVTPATVKETLEQWSSKYEVRELDGKQVVARLP